MKIPLEQMLEVVESIRGHDYNSLDAAAVLEFVIDECIILAPDNRYVLEDSWTQPASILRFPILQETVRGNYNCVSQALRPLKAPD